MYQDENLIFSTGQAETTVATHVSSITIDTELVDPNFGPGKPKWVNCVIDTTCDSVGAATLKVALQDSVGGSTWTDLVAGEAYLLSLLASGFVPMSVPLPAEHKRYLRMVYTIGASVLTSGAWNAWIGLAPIKSR